jgi:fatty acid desaturase
MGSLTPFWIIIVVLAIIAALVNFAIGASRRAEPLVFAVRLAAGVASLAAAAFIVVGKVGSLIPFILTWPERIILAGVFVFAVLFIPSAVERNREQTEPTIQQRAARPANATVRLREGGSDEWVN